ncbi:monooxygenase [Actinophytocola xinjiangensis]|uniref:Monooxygenase n=1 Tax=Actinophytocola xinjiangensis TaxID=485602 RepID=A0A7Z1AY34_9PSEU|nr:FAD-dependent monooxygenase [Actinophytocola xinjiangensis]OLF10072.1 monooxygenase [Actinophytocola xinjiangensis]
MRYDVIIAGCGPTGAMLAAELRLHDLRVLVLEKHTEPPSFVRIVSLHIRSLEIMAMRGLLGALQEHGRQRPAAGFFAAIPAPVPDGLDTPYPYLLGLQQPTIVRLLEDHATALGAHVRHGHAVTAARQDDDGVTVDLDNGERFHASYLVGCDGARSVVRREFGIGFPGEPSRDDTLMGELSLTTAPTGVPTGLDRRVTIQHFGEDTYRVVVPAEGVSDETPTLADFQRQLRAFTGTDLGAHSPRWLSRFGDATRLAEHYRVGRVLLAGDAAHIHPPIGGQGLNLGVQDAVNLGWKLAALVRGWAPDTLLDTYHAERHPVAASVLDNTRAQRELMSPEPGAQALRRLITELMDINDVNRHLTGMITALDVRYDFGDVPAPVGLRQPDVELRDGRLYDLLRHGRGLLLDPTATLRVAGWSDRVDHVTDPQAPTVLLRPDGHIAWAGGDQRDLDTQLTRWFGTPC